MRFVGHSQVVDPTGQIIAGSGEEECLVWAEVNREMVSRVRTEFPALKDRVFKDVT
ncbi:MAG: nitrilase-related carbon-nitrogen hydrolase [Thermodesulfobacteriota bacterium]